MQNLHRFSEAAQNPKSLAFSPTARGMPRAHRAVGSLGQQGGVVTIPDHPLPRTTLVPQHL